MIALEHLSSLVEEEYKPYDLSFGTAGVSKLSSSEKLVERGKMSFEIMLLGRRQFAGKSANYCCKMLI